MRIKSCPAANSKPVSWSKATVQCGGCGHRCVADCCREVKGIGSLVNLHHGMSARVIKHFWTTSQKAEAAASPSIPLQPDPPAVDVTVNTLGALSLDEVPAAPYSKPNPNQEAGSLRRPNHELASQSLTPEPLQSGLASSEAKVSIWLSLEASWPGSAQLCSVWPGSRPVLLPVFLPPSATFLFSVVLPCMSAEHSAALKIQRCLCG